MLKKLFKHEFKATYRFYLPIYIALAILITLACVYLKITEHFDVNELFLSITMPLGTVVGVLAILFTLISPYIFICLRFYRSTATREAYLTFTLPATTNQILLSKFLVSLIWAVLTAAVTLLALLVLAAVGIDAELTFSAIREFLNYSQFDVMTFLSFVFGYINSILAIYAAISLGQFVRDHRVIASIAFYVAIYMVQQIVSLVVLIPIMIGTGVFSNPDDALADMGILSWTSIGISILFSVIFYLISNRILDRKLNLP